MAPDDLRDFPLPNLRPPEETGAEEAIFAIDAAVVAISETAQREPLLDTGPVIVGFGDEANAPPEAPAGLRRRRRFGLGLAGSLGVHLLPLLFLLYWNAPAARIAEPIPVTLVLEQPTPKPKPEERPPPGRLASTNIGDPAAKPVKPAPDSLVDEPETTSPAPTATTRSPARPELVSALPKPAPLPEPELKLPDPVVQPAVSIRPSPAKPPIRHEAAARPVPHAPADPAWGRIPGPTATEDEYLAYANALIRRNQELIPASLLRGRNGTAVISILVLADGTIASIAIKDSSGYPDIDQHAERMVAAVKRFPPLPKWFQGTSMVLSYHMLFGDRMVLP